MAMSLNVNANTVKDFRAQHHIRLCPGSAIVSTCASGIQHSHAPKSIPLTVFFWPIQQVTPWYRPSKPLGVQRQLRSKHIEQDRTQRSTHTNPVPRGQLATSQVLCTEASHGFVTAHTKENQENQHYPRTYQPRRSMSGSKCSLLAFGPLQHVFGLVKAYPLDMLHRGQGQCHLLRKRITR
ncbi:uncharacterized protein B0I36DRAFT_85384 [Microdochium trichocladiopsis]|uniref:Uncharacterized protein n=1 Tax=Microdochium trichocladiopsis TaxID=1682393 RepID=A0A9P8YAV8_9PEZI|nr:uncharacterized protein B0I36DRAFT_85384 [Microdochium trichocladiopsis]KAH7034897.1 hypothetical protein B0I36DRAFT_85384 [Microdochium trichocladiopsis]